MTSTQVAYWNYKESARHNLATEGIQQEANKISAGQLAESIRHNQATEKISILNLNETKRHNVVSEKLTVNQIKEQHRHNVATEHLTQSQISEQRRHNVQTEAIQSFNANTQRITAESNAALNAAKTNLTQLDIKHYVENNLLKSRNTAAQILGLAGYGVKEVQEYIDKLFGPNTTMKATDAAFSSFINTLTRRIDQRIQKEKAKGKSVAPIIG